MKSLLLGILSGSIIIISIIIILVIHFGLFKNTSHKTPDVTPHKTPDVTPHKTPLSMGGWKKEIDAMNCVDNKNCKEMDCRKGDGDCFCLSRCPNMTNYYNCSNKDSKKPKCPQVDTSSCQEAESDPQWICQDYGGNESIHNCIEIKKPCCKGLAKNYKNGCGTKFDCSRSIEKMKDDDECLTRKSGAECLKDNECVVQGLGLKTSGEPSSYICINKRYGLGGIGVDGDDKYYDDCLLKKLSKVQFKGRLEGCSPADGVKSGGVAITKCCTPDVDCECHGEGIYCPGGEKCVDSKCGSHVS